MLGQFSDTFGQLTSNVTKNLHDVSAIASDVIEALKDHSEEDDQPRPKSPEPTASQPLPSYVDSIDDDSSAPQSKSRTDLDGLRAIHQSLKQKMEATPTAPKSLNVKVTEFIKTEPASELTYDQVQREAPAVLDAKEQTGKPNNNIVSHDPFFDTPVTHPLTSQTCEDQPEESAANVPIPSDMDGVPQPEYFGLDVPNDNDTSSSSGTIADEGIPFSEAFECMTRQNQDVMSLNETLLLEAEKTAAELATYQTLHQELQDTVSNLRAQIDSLNDANDVHEIEVTDQEKQIRKWKNDYVEEIKRTTQLQRRLKEFESQSAAHASAEDFNRPAAEGLANILKEREETIGQLNSQIIEMSLHIKEAKLENDMLKEVLKDNRQTHETQVATLSTQLGRHSDLERDNDALRKSKLDAENQIQALDLKLARHSDVEMSLKSDIEKRDEKIQQLELATKILLDKMTHWQVNEDSMVHVDEVKSAIENAVASYATSSHCLDARARWEVLRVVSEHLQMTSWQAQWWLGLSEKPPSGTPGDGGWGSRESLGSKFLAFLESETEVKDEESNSNKESEAS